MALADRVAVYAGREMDCVNLQLLLAGNGIAVEVESRGAASLFSPASILFVAQSDLERACVLVEEFNLSHQKNA